MDSKDKLVTLEDLKAVHDEVARYTTCSTAAGTSAKTAALTNFVLTTGSAVKVKFTNTNTAANPTLNINSTGAKPIMQYGTTAAGITPPESWNDGAVVEFVYDGTNWVMQGRNTIDAVSKANGGTFNGNVIVEKRSGSTALADSYLVAGNNIPNGTAGNSRGVLELFSEQSYYANIYPRTLTGNRSLYVPDATGTIAIKEPVNLDTTADLNNLNQPTDSGMYYIQSSAVNAPTVWASLEVIARPNGGCTQIVTSTNGIWVRQYTGSPLAWSIWKKYVSADQVYSYTPSVTAPSVTGFSVDNITFSYKLTSEFLWLSGRFRVVNHGTGDNYINISYPTGVRTITGVGSFGTVHVTNSFNSSALSIRPSNDGTYCFIQSGAGNTSVSGVIPNGYYVVIQAMIPLR